MQTKEVTVRLQALDGTWEVGGRDRKRGIWPENVQLTSDLWGSATASFDLRRNPRAIWPDLGAYTPIEIEVGGEIVWSGRISETPSRDAADRVISVQAQGWQYHLDDDIYEKPYVHANLSDWRDARTFPGIDLAAHWYSVPQVNNDNNAITFGLPQNIQMPADTRAGVILDLGPYATAASIAVTYTSSNNSPNFSLVARSFQALNGSNGDLTDPFYSDAFTVLNNASAGQTKTGTFASPCRYVAVLLSGPSGLITSSFEIFFQISAITVFTNDSYRSGSSSILKASTVIADALTQATALLSTDRTGITPTSFSMRSLAFGEPKTPREVWAAVNAYHDYISQIDVSKRPIFKAKPSIPMFEVGAWSPLELEDQSANSGDDIYNRVIVTGTQPDGSPLRVSRFSGYSVAGVSQPANPSAVASTANWTPGTGVALTRDTGVFNSSPASFRFSSANSGTANPVTSDTVTQTLKAGRRYRLSVAVRITSFLIPVFDITVLNGATVLATTNIAPLINTLGTWATYTLEWVQATDVSSYAIKFDPHAGGGSGIAPNRIWFDDVLLEQAAVTRPDRRRFTRTKALPVSAQIDTASAQTIGDLWLAAHKTTPYKGTFKLTGDRAVRDPTTGTRIPLERLLLHTGELIRDTAAIDPDTGGVGRDGRIAQVTYTPASEEATVTLDNSRASYEALLARLDLLTSSG